MKLLFKKSDLLNAINIVLKAVPSKTTMSILECILVDASSGEVHLVANDMELGIETIVDSTVFEAGKIAIDAKLFSEIVRKLPDSDVMIEADDNYNVTIQCEKALFHISGKNAEEFSYLPQIEKETHIAISQFTLKETIRQTIFSISQSDSNKMMGGELFEVKGDELKVTSLDGHRISIRKVRMNDTYDHVKVVVPGKTLNEISKILAGDKDKEVMIYFSRNHILFEFDQTMVVSRLIEGEYFRIDQMLSGDYETKIVLNKRELQDCIERSILLVRESDKKPIILNIEDSSMELSMNSAIGSMKEDIMVNKTGQDIMIGFNPRFLLDALRVIDDEEVTLYMINSKAPCFIRDEESTYIYLILPVNFTAVRR